MNKELAEKEAISFYDKRKLFWNNLNLNDDNINRLVKLWHIYGNNGSKHTDPNHHAIQGIIQHGEITIDSWKITSKELKDIIEKEFPVLFNTIKTFKKSKRNRT